MLVCLVCLFAATVTSLSWDPVKGRLFSASYDKIIIIWDVGGKQGISYDLDGHKDRVTCVQFMPKSHQLVSCSEDSKIVIWDMLAKRRANPDWVQQDDCTHCKAPFFWNYKAMWEKRVVGKRQHHCRKCGAAVCDDCSNNRSTIPSLGHEFSVRICSQCINSINHDEKTPLAQFYEAKQMITSMSFDTHRKYLLTIGTDRSIKVSQQTFKHPILNENFFILILHFSDLGHVIDFDTVRAQSRTVHFLFSWRIFILYL